MTETLKPFYGSIAEVRERTKNHDANRRAVFEAQTASTPITATTRVAGIPPAGSRSVIEEMNAVFDRQIAEAPLEHRAAVRVEVEKARAEWMANAEKVAARHEKIRSDALKRIV
jgi:hypothetical protein